MNVLAVKWLLDEGLVQLIAAVFYLSCCTTGPFQLLAITGNRWPIMCHDTTS